MKYRIPFLSEISNESLISVLSRIFNAFCFYLITAKVSRTFSREQFAIWTVFVTTINLLPILTFGLTTGLVNRLSFNNSNNDNKLSKKNFIIVSSVFIIQVFVSTLFIILTLSSFKLFPQLKELQKINNFYNLKYIIITLLFSLPFQAYSSILFAYKKINESNYMSVIQNIFLFSTTLFSSKLFFSEVMLDYSIVYTSSFVLFFIYSIVVNNIRLCIPKYKIAIKYIKIIIKPSILFWIMSVVSNILSNAQIFFVTYFFGLQSVPEFFLFQRLFSIINTFQLAYLSPYTIKFISFAANNEWEHIKQLIKNLFFKLTIPLYLIVGITFVLFHPIIIKLWTNMTVVNYIACILFFISFFLTSVSNIFSVLLTSLGHFRIQIILSIIAFILFFTFLFITKNILESYSIIFSIIPSAIITIYIFYNYTKDVLKKKLHFV
jgi:O-antigen/teichoic acid export membrane protein